MRLAWGLKNAFPTASCSVNWNWNWHWAPVALSLLPSGEDLTLKANKQPPSPASYNDCTKSNKVWSKVFVVLFLTIRLSKDLGSFLLKKKKNLRFEQQKTLRILPECKLLKILPLEGASWQYYYPISIFILLGLLTWPKTLKVLFHRINWSHFILHHSDFKDQFLRIIGNHNISYSFLESIFLASSQ